MKICVGCGNKLSDDEKKCPICKLNAKEAVRVDENDKERIAEIVESIKIKGNSNKQTKKKPKGCLIAIIIIIALGMFGITSLMNNPSPVNSPSDVGQKLTLEKYNTIQNGMTYDEVIKIIGFEVSPEVEVGEKGTAYYTASYRYMGDDQVKGTLGANASFMFQGGKLNTKAQMGLE
jgi:RNA polymerase subunit RPABC4/transcription elongation factor Spt4